MKKGRWIAAEHIKARVLFLSEKDRQNISKKSKNNTDFLLKIAVSAGLKFSKKAVERNRIRRQISAVLESLVGRVSHLNGAFIMFVPDIGLAECDHGELESILVGLVNRMIKK